MRTPVSAGPRTHSQNLSLDMESLRREANDAFELIRANFRELLLNEKLASVGSRNGPSEIPMPIHAAGWKNLAWPKIKNSTVAERVGSKTKIFNVRVFPILHSARATTLLNGVSLADAFRRYVVEDPEVIALGRRVIVRDGHRDVFENGQAPGPIVGFHWLLNVDAKGLAEDFVRPLAWFDSTDFQRPSQEIVNASMALADRCQALRHLLATGQIGAFGTFAQTGMTGAIHRMQWQRSGVTIEVQNGDLCEGENHRPVVRWSGIVLEAPPQIQLFSSTNPFSDNAPVASAVQKAASNEAKRTTAVRESIKEATLALWPNGIPRSLQLQQRDSQIMAWQRKNERTVVSPKSIRRHLSPDGRLL